MAFFENLLDLQDEAENAGTAPATSGQNAPGEVEAGPDQNTPDFDQQDLGTIPDPITQEETGPASTRRRQLGDILKIENEPKPVVEHDDVARDEAGEPIVFDGQTISATANP